MTTHPEGERVEITPELLEYICEKASRVDAPVSLLSPQQALALVERIRELERTNAELWTMFEEMRDEAM